MALPPVATSLEQLRRNIPIDGAHGVTADPNAHVALIPVCRVTDTPLFRLKATPNGELSSISLGTAPNLKREEEGEKLTLPNHWEGTDLKPEEKAKWLAERDNKLQDFNEVLWQQVVGARGNFIYSELMKDGHYSPSFQPICRSEKPTMGEVGKPEARYAVYMADMRWLQHPPSSPNLAAVSYTLPGDDEVRPFEFELNEIAAIVSAVQISAGQYGIELSPSGRFIFSIAPDKVLLTRIRDFINSEKSPIDEGQKKGFLTRIIDRKKSPSRREVMTQAFQPENIGALEAQEGMRAEMRYSMIAMGVLQVVTTAYALGKGAGWIFAATLLPRVIGTPLLEGALNVFTVPINAALRLSGKPALDLNFRWSRELYRDVDGRFRYRGLSTVLSSGTNLTELARRGEIRPAVDSGTEVMIERIMNRINTPRRAGSAIVEAPPGWGKEILMRNLALKNQNIVFVQTQPDDLMSGTMYRGTLEEKLKNIPKEIEAALKRGQRVVLCIDEFHEAITAGKSMEETRSLLERWKGPLANGTLRIVGFSTPDEMLKIRYQAGLYDSVESRDFLTDRQRNQIEQWETNPAKYNIRMSDNIRPLLNRFRGFEAPVRTTEDMRAMLNDGLEIMRTQDQLTVQIEPRTIDLIVKLSESPVSGEGFIPRSAFDLLDGVIASAGETTDKDRPIQITHADFETYVKTSWPRVAQRFGLLPTPPPPAPITAPTPAPATATPSTSSLKPVEVKRAAARTALKHLYPSVNWDRISGVDDLIRKIVSGAKGMDITQSDIVASKAFTDVVRRVVETEVRTSTTITLREEAMKREAEREEKDLDPLREAFEKAKKRSMN